MIIVDRAELKYDGIDGLEKKLVDKLESRERSGLVGKERQAGVPLRGPLRIGNIGTARKGIGHLVFPRLRNINRHQGVNLATKKEGF